MTTKTAKKKDYTKGLIRCWFYWTPEQRERFKINLAKNGNKTQQEVFSEFVDKYGKPKD